MGSERKRNYRTGEVTLNPLHSDPFHDQNIKSLTLKMYALGFIAVYSRLEEGPIINTYYFKPAPNALLGKILAKADDLALSVGAEHLLIQRERDEISIAVPKLNRELIKFDSLLYWLGTEPSNKEMSLPLLMGQTTRGENFSLDLSEQPHILIGGSTGSGKSVFINQLICALAVLKDPKDLKLILVDTKQLDLTLMGNLQHVERVVDRIEDLYTIFEDLMREVRRRTNLMKGIARNIKEYNSMEYGYPLPYYILIIDELADIIGQDKAIAKTEDKDSKRTRIGESLRNLAQISRAVGIHIIASTQRPDVKIVDGTLKANLPTRICFRLPTGIDSRVILDENGAENLLGKGDYLYKTSSDSTMKRAHGSFVDLNDISRILIQNREIRESLIALSSQF